MAKGTKAGKQTTVGTLSILDRMESGVWGLGIAVLGVLILLALISFVMERGNGNFIPSSNLIGPVGGHLALHLFTLFGAAGLLLALAVVALGVSLIAQRLEDVPREHLLGAAVIILPAAILLHFITPTETTLPQGWGGVIGKALGEWILARLLGQAGTWVLALAAIVAGMSIIFRIHVKTFFLVPYFQFSRLVKKLMEQRGERNDTSSTVYPDTVGDEDSGTGSVPRVVRKDEASTNVQRPLQAVLVEAVPEEPVSEEPIPDFILADSPDSTRVDAPDTAVEAPAEKPHSEVVPVTTKDSKLLAANSADPIDSSTDGNVGIATAKVVRPAKKEYEKPDVALLDYHAPSGREVDDKALHGAAEKLQMKLEDFKIDGAVGDIHPGPVIALFEFRPGRGIKVSTIANLSKDIAMALAAEQVRIVAPIPGRDVVGFEIPNKIREMVYLRELLSHASYKKGKQRLPLILGKDIAGNPTITDLTKMPHLLVAGTTGSGKSVAVHSFILSIIFRRTPEEVKFIFIDPKMLELTAYAEIPHLLWPVVTEARDAAVALRWAVSEMERRNRLMSKAGVPNITEYNQWARKKGKSPAVRAAVTKVTKDEQGQRSEEIISGEEIAPEILPYIVVVIDELADLMMVAGKQVESSIARLAGMARASGIHMIIATQNPTIKVVTGIIKANMPSQISFKVRTMQDSRVILDQNGADDLLGYGDMLFLGPGSSKLNRIHGAFVSTEERCRVVEHIRAQGPPEYNQDIQKAMTEMSSEEEDDSPLGGGGSKSDLYGQALSIAISRGKISTSALQRELGIGYNKAAVLMSRMEKEGVVGPPEAAGKPRIVLRSH
jgi:DNA segregation ATPase FtsK/SpoIIIE-like protein